MAGGKVVAVTAESASGTCELTRVVECVLEGARSAGLETEHFLLCRESEAASADRSRYTDVISSAGRMRDLALRVPRCEQFILASTGNPRSSDSVLGQFIQAVYENAKWQSLEDVAGGQDDSAAPGAPADAQTFRFVVPGRVPGGLHKGIAILHPDGQMPDHDDPFSENGFFVLEEVQRVLGFMPSGRVLSTGLFDVPLESNPILKRQALEIGRRLGAEAGTPAGK